MIYKTIDLYKEFGVKRGDNKAGYLTVYTHENSHEINESRKYPCMLVMPGGAYLYVSDREKEPIALRYFAAGYNAYVLNYSVEPSRYPTQLIEAAMAMAYIRRNAEELHNDSAHVAAIGFSAGGHLCGSISTMYGEKVIFEKTGITAMEAKPNASVFAYAVVCTEYPQETYFHLCEEKPEIMAKVNIAANVDKNTSPMFIWCTANDPVVDPGNSLAIASACRKNGVPFDLHIYRDGEHGLSNGDKSVWKDEHPHSKLADRWLDDTLLWLSELGFDYVD